MRREAREHGVGVSFVAATIFAEKFNIKIEKYYEAEKRSKE